MNRRPLWSSTQMPSALAIVETHGLDSDWWMKVPASRFRRDRVTGVDVFATHAARATEVLLSPSVWIPGNFFMELGVSQPEAAHQRNSSTGKGHRREENKDVGSWPRERICLDRCEELHRFQYAFFHTVP